MIVYTSVVGDKYPLREDHVSDGANFVAFVDNERESTLWQQRKAYDRFLSNRRNSRAPKLLAHQFIDSEYSLWLDNNLALRVPMQQLVDEWLNGYDLAVFRHPERSCLYEEAEICALYKLDDPLFITEQAAKYMADDYGRNRGLAECNMILRRHTNKVEEFNNAWFSEYCRHSVRDQISFMYAANRVGLRVNFINPSARAGNPYIHWQLKAATDKELMAMQKEI